MRRRILPAAAVVALGLVALTSCSSAEDARAACTVPLAPGALSNGVAVDGDGGVEVTGATEILNAQRTVLEQGESGDLIEPGGVALLDVEVVDAVTGEVLQSQSGAPYAVLPESRIAETEAVLASASDSMSLTLQYLIVTSLLCSAPGDTLVVAATAQQSMASQLSYNPTVAVVHVRDGFPARAEGSVRGLPSGFPAVAVDETGRPGVVLPPQAAPNEVRSASRIVGDGAEITAEQSVIANVLTVAWDGSVVSNTWESGLVVLGSEESPNPEYAFRDRLTGVPVGSQVVVLDPGDGSPVVHVIDAIAVF